MPGSVFKPVVWIGPSRKDLKTFPEAVQKEVGDALQDAQYGLKPLSAKPLAGFGGASVLEIKADHDSNAYRAVYTVRFAEYLYVLHAFQKKSTRGIQTAKRDIELIRTRLRAAEAAHAERLSRERENP